MKKLLFLCLMVLGVTALIGGVSTSNADDHAHKKMVVKKIVKAEKATKIQEKKLSMSVKHIKGLIKEGKLKLENGTMSYQGASGYHCDAEADSCICAGDESSSDCQAMFRNICQRDSEGNPIYTCLPGGCTCSIFGTDVGGGINGNGGIGQTQTSH